MAPLGFRFRPVRIECWVTEIRSATFTMAYEVFHDTGSEEGGEAEGGRRVYLRATTVLSPYVFGAEHPRRLTAGERERLEQFLEAPADPAPRPERFSVAREEAGHYPVHVRFSDVDVYGHVNNVKYFEYLQESRIRWFSTIGRDLDLPRLHFVVARTEVDYRRPILFRPDPYDVWTELGRFGNRSMTVHSHICDGDEVLARAKVTTVFYDLEAQRSEAVRERLRSLAPTS